MSNLFYPTPTTKTAGLDAFHPVLLDAASDTVAAAGAVSVNTSFTKVTTGAGAMAITLADGVVHGQYKHIQMTTDGGGDATLAITSPVSTSFDQIVFADVGDFAVLVWNEEEGYWRILVTGNDADGTSAPVVS